MSLPYPVREGLAGFRRAPFAAFASTSAMVVALVLIGVFLFLTLQGQAVAQYLRQRVGEMEVFLAPGTDSVAARVLTARAGTYPGVADARLVPDREARREYEETFGEPVDAGVLPVTIRLRLNESHANLDSLRGLDRRLRTFRDVEDVVYDTGLIGRVGRNLRLLQTGGLLVVVLVVAAALFLVANTIRLTIYARRLVIRTMKLVGATDRFIRLPFLVEGIVQGLVAGVVAMLVLWALFALVTAAWADGVVLHDRPVGRWLPLVSALVLGLVLGWGGTLVALRRFIRRVALH